MIIYLRLHLSYIVEILCSLSLIQNRAFLYGYIFVWDFDKLADRNGSWVVHVITPSLLLE